MHLSRISTRWYTASTSEEREKALTEGARILRHGGLVAFPTETVYGLGAHSFHPRALQKIFRVKGRPSDNPLIVHLAHLEEMQQVAAKIPAAAYLLAERFWPGPLTIVLPRREDVPCMLSGGLPTVAVRVPSHPLARDLLKRVAAPVSAPSANLSGRPSPTRAQHVWDDLAGKIEAVLDGGDAAVGLESTVVSLHGEEPVLLRPGGITREQLEQTLQREIRVPADPSENSATVSSAPVSPGMKYRHYSPQAPLYLVMGTPERIEEKIRQYGKSRAPDKHGKVGLLCSNELDYALTVLLATTTGKDHHLVVEKLGPRQDHPQMAASFFKGMRRLDEHGVEVILAEGYPESGIGLALMNRLKKAAQAII